MTRQQTIELLESVEKLARIVGRQDQEIAELRRRLDRLEVFTTIHSALGQAE